MRLNLCTFPVNDIVFGSRTKWDNGTLELNHDELLEPVLAEPSIAGAKLEIARPGESTRIINYFDILEPRVKVEGRGTVYPGRCGRSVDTVGEGRTHRLSGMTLMSCLDDPGTWGADGWVPREPEYGEVTPGRRKVWTSHRFVGMSGDPSILPYGSLINVCLSIRLKEGLSRSDHADVNHAALLRLSDTLAETTIGLEPPETEVFDTSEKNPSLPGVVFTCLLASSEARAGPRSAAGTAIYGVTRLSAPWVLDPTEMLDGALTGGGSHVTWPFINNPVVLNLCRRHGKTINFLGCIIGRTNWGGEEEMRLSGNRAAKVAQLLGAKGAIITNDVRGRRYVDSVRTLQAFEDVGIKTVFLSEEEDNENGNAPPFLYHPAEMTAVVSTGTGSAGPFPAVDQVIGWVDRVDPGWYPEQPAVPGRYGAGHVRDHYGVGRHSCVDY